MKVEEKNENIFTLKDEKGNEVEFERLFTFDSDVTKKSYIAYTDHSKDENGRELVYASIYDPTGKDLNLYPIETDEEWQELSNILNSAQAQFNDENEEE